MKMEQEPYDLRETLALERNVRYLPLSSRTIFFDHSGCASCITRTNRAVFRMESKSDAAK